MREGLPKEHKPYESAPCANEQFSSQAMSAVATFAPPLRVKGATRRTSDVHGAGKEVGNGIATAENSDSYADI